MQLHAAPPTLRVLRAVTASLPGARENAPWQLSLRAARPDRWLLPVVAMVAGALATGLVPHSPVGVARIAFGAILCGPLYAGLGSVVNAIFDRDLDSVIHPDRPIPSGALPLNVIVAQMGLMGMLMLLFAHLLDHGLGLSLSGRFGVGSTDGSGVFYAILSASALVFAMNAPPLSFRRQTWASGVFTALTTVFMPWLVGILLFAHPTSGTLLMGAGFAYGAVGLFTLGTLGAVEAHRRVGLRTLAALLGPEMGLLIGSMLLLTSLVATGILMGFRQPALAVGVAVTALAQLTLVWRGFRVQPERPSLYALAVALYGIAMILAGWAGAGTGLLG